MVSVKSIKSIEKASKNLLSSFTNRNKYMAVAYTEGNTFCIEVTKSLDIRIYCNWTQLDTGSSQYTALMKSNNISGAVYSMIKAIKSSNYDMVCLLGILNKAQYKAYMAIYKVDNNYYNYSTDSLNYFFEPSVLMNCVELPKDVDLLNHDKRFTGKQHCSGVLFVPVLSLELEMDKRKAIDTGVYSYLYNKEL